MIAARRVTVAIAAGAVALALAAGSEARAEERALSPVPRPAAVAAAVHRGSVGGDRITWRSRFVVQPGAGPGGVEVRLASPLPAGIDVDEARSPGVRATRDARGRVVAIAHDAAATDEVSVVVVQPVASRADLTLHPPLAAGDEVQAVTLEGRDDVRFEPEARLGVARHVTYSVAVDVDDASRHAADALLALPVGVGQPPPLYVRARGPMVDPGLVGSVTTAHERSRPAYFGAIALFVLGVGALAVLYRRFSRDARVEQAEADLRGEFERLSRGVGG